MRPTIVYVHGNGNKVRKDLLERQWNEALFGQDMPDSSRMAYRASLRYAQPLPDPAFDEMDLLPVSPLEVAPPPALESAEAFIAKVLAEARQEAEAAPGPESTGDAGSLEAWMRDLTHHQARVCAGREVHRLPRHQRQRDPSRHPAVPADRSRPAADREAVPGVAAAGTSPLISGAPAVPPLASRRAGRHACRTWVRQ